MKRILCVKGRLQGHDSDYPALESFGILIQKSPKACMWPKSCYLEIRYGQLI
jgi:hypothetical protein